MQTPRCYSMTADRSLMLVQLPVQVPWLNAGPAEVTPTAK